MRKVLIANRGEIAVRVARACRDAGLASVAVYAEQDLDSLHVRMADEAHALGGQSPAQTYLDVAKLLRIAARTGADAVHPGYGFLAENADFACAVIEAGLTWIGPPPSAIAALGDKVRARHIAASVGAPLAAGTSEPVRGAAEVVAFAREHGLPIAIKAAYGGGGRGLKVARTLEEILDLYDSAVREATKAFGRGECFVERYLDRPRHVETQCLADKYGDVVVVSTRDCSLQRRHQKLVEEAPAPFLTEEQTEILYSSSKAILRAAGYSGAGTCEFLVARDGTISFLEVNTRLQVEHPVSEEVTGIDLVREMFRIADGQPLGYGDPEVRGHSIEFRLNAEDPGRDFLPAPGTLTAMRVPSGPGVRVDCGYEAGMTVPQTFDSLVAKLVVTGRTRTEALERSRRALAEMEIDGMPTVLPFHRAVVTDSAFTSAPFTVHTSWIETEFANTIPPFAGSGVLDGPAPSLTRERVLIEVGGRRLEVVMPALSGTAVPAPARPASRRSATGVATPAARGTAVTSSMQATVVMVARCDGDLVEKGDLVAVIEAMKMEQAITAHKPGMIARVGVSPGQTIATGAVICEILDV
ncbi:acetyl/propionyl/methylcrotonyl-CoA carboxylase subunit alpha [Nonomuraea sp. NPDC050663]|uniref:acetyl/propionyl/methylcrotonyl-CoA carboxylase subunit alpha n=1 Tax=Nonomuraea sp. NPDC050663 TaxID=3364370 RepID=UPI0037B5F0C9